jgi:hypothetical protein
MAKTQAGGVPIAVPMSCCQYMLPNMKIFQHTMSSRPEMIALVGSPAASLWVQEKEAIYTGAKSTSPPWFTLERSLQVLLRFFVS